MRQIPVELLMCWLTVAFQPLNLAPSGPVFLITRLAYILAGAESARPGLALTLKLHGHHKSATESREAELGVSRQAVSLTMTEPCFKARVVPRCYHTGVAHAGKPAGIPHLKIYWHTLL